MRIIYRIAKLELSTLFYSPVAWLVLIIFTIQAGFQYTNCMGLLETSREIGRYMGKMTYSVFVQGPGGGLLSEMLRKLYLYIPLLTMGLMSRETSSGSIKLLHSSPVKVSEIILGKFMAMMVYGLILVTILLLFVAAAALTVPALDIKLILSGLLGIYLVICAYTAIGLYMSCLTSYQVVAAISTLAVLAALNYVKTLGQKIDVVRDITYYLSLAGRSDDMLSGLINSRDVLYFLLVTFFFLGLSMLKLLSSRESKPWPVKAGRYGLLTGALVAGVYLSSRPSLIAYEDMTANKSLTVTPNSQAILDSLKGRVTMTTYVNLLDSKALWGLPENRNIDKAHFESYTRFLPDMKMDYVYYYDTCAYAMEIYFKQYPQLSLKQVAQKVATAFKVDLDLFMPPDSIRQRINLLPEGNRLVRLLEVNGKKTWLRMYDDISGYPAEAEVSSALKQLIVPSPAVAFLTGHQERSINKTGDRDFKMPTTEGAFRQALINQGFKVVELSAENQDIPAEVSVLAITDPRTPLTGEEQSRINAYIKRGGNLLIAGEPGKQEILNPLLAPLGVQYMPGTLIQTSQDYPGDYILTYLTSQAKALTEGFNSIGKYRAGTVTMPGAMGIQYTNTGNFIRTPLLVTRDTSNRWNRIQPFNRDSINMQYLPAAGDTRGVFPVAVALQRVCNNRQQRIIVTGDADFMNNYEIFRTSQGSFYRVNFLFYGELCKWLGNGAFPVDVSRPETKDTGFKPGGPANNAAKIIFLLIIPAILLAGGAILLIIRRRN